MGILGDAWDAVTNPGTTLSKVMGTYNKTNATAPQLDANAYQYGGRAGYADEEAQRLQQQGQAAQSRLGTQANYKDANYYQTLGQQDRGQQQSALQLQQQAAMGNAPSRAEILGQGMADQAAATQQSLAASARGPAAMALAQQNAAANTANAQTQIAGQSMAQRADEMAQARNAYQAGATGLRASDLSAQQQGAQQSQFNAQLAAQQRAQNDQFQLGMTQAQQNVRNAQLQAQMQQQAQNSQNQLGATGINAQVNAGNAQAAGNATQGLMGGGSSLLSALPLLGSDENMKGSGSLSRLIASPGESKVSDPNYASGAVVPYTVKSTIGTGADSTGYRAYNAFDPNERQMMAAHLSAQDMLHNDPDAMAALYKGRNVNTSGMTEADARAAAKQLQMDAAVRANDMRTMASPEEIAGGDALKDPSGVWRKVPKAAPQATPAAVSSDAKSAGPNDKKLKELGSALGALGKDMTARSQNYSDAKFAIPTAAVPVAQLQQQSLMASPEGMKTNLADMLGGLNPSNYTSGPTAGPMQLLQQGGQALGTGLARMFMGSDERCKMASPEGEKYSSFIVGAPWHEAGYDIDQEGNLARVGGGGGDRVAKEIRLSKTSDSAGAKSAPTPMARVMGTRKPTLDEASAWADRELAKTRGQQESIGAAVPVVQTTSGKTFVAPSPNDMEDYLASTRGSVYQYKDPNMPGASPGSQVGPPSAQDMQKTRIGQTMVETDPRTGMVAIDKDKALKTSMSGLSYLNDKVNGLARVLGR